MYAPTPIRAALEEPHRFERLQRLLASGEVSSRSSASRLVCEAFDLRDGCGRLRRSSCMAALAGLERAGRISLPASTGALPRGRPRGLPHALPLAGANWRLKSSAFWVSRPAIRQSAELSDRLILVQKMPATGRTDLAAIPRSKTQGR